MKTRKITLEKISKCFQEGEVIHEVLKGITYTFEQGKTYAITGVSGTGKSTLLTLLAGLEAPTSGKVLYQDTDIATFSEWQKIEFLSSEIGLVFQQPFLIKELSVLENLLTKDIITGTLRDDSDERANQLLHAVGLQEKKSSRVSALSGGQQQRLALARALYNKPAFLLADELTGNLDVATGQKIVDLLLELQRNEKMGIIMSSHDPYVAKKMEVVCQLRDGSLYEK